MPTLREFIDGCCERHGCSVTHMKGKGPRGEFEVTILAKSNGKRWEAVLPDMDDDTQLAAGMLASLCRRLDIPAHDFGLFIG